MIMTFEVATYFQKFQRAYLHIPRLLNDIPTVNLDIEFACVVYATSN